ncbi:MAG: hypothetical protein IPJ07_12710 [Acidobacteria bacterium]|nr:hypothetical protein [Acidobacteriota bacterium]
MPDFNQSREQLQQSRDEKAQAQKSLFDAKEQLRTIETRQAELERTFDPHNQDHIVRRNRLKEERAAAHASVEKNNSLLNKFKEVEAAHFKDWAVFTDPRTQIANFSDQYPFLMLPVRIETRFKVDNQKKQMWVRIYPDECAVDTFEETLTEIEVASAKQYWINVWRAGGIEDQERGAWRSIAASHRSGRAAWIIENYRPLNETKKPVKAKADDIVLVIATDQPLSDADLTAAAEFWQVIWLAAGDKTKVDEATDKLKLAVGDARAAEIIEKYQPANFDQKPATTDTAFDVKVSTVVFPLPEDTQTKKHSWSMRRGSMFCRTDSF